MAMFKVEPDGKVIKTFEAKRFSQGGETFWFYDENEIVGGIIVKPGMSVTKEGHEGTKQQRL